MTPTKNINTLSANKGSHNQRRISKTCCHPQLHYIASCVSVFPLAGLERAFWLFARGSDCRRGDNIIHEDPSLIRWTHSGQCTIRSTMHTDCKEAGPRAGEIIQAGSPMQVLSPLVRHKHHSLSLGTMKIFLPELGSGRLSVGRPLLDYCPLEVYGSSGPDF